ncbi:MAG: TIGR02996 domain-containing protein [Myxococcota bacterium]
MSTVAALEDHFRRQPHDWAAWLVYGDHLSGQGDVRGELIRLEHQHATARLTAEERKKLAADIAALIKEHRKAWSGSAPESVALQWEHGFITGVRLSWTEERGAALKTFLASPESRLLRALAVTRLGDDEGDEDFDEEDEENFDEETGMPRRRFDAKAMTAALEGVLALDLSRVLSLSFAYLGMRATGAKLLAGATGLTQLEHLDLRYNELKDAGLKALCEAGFLPQLRSLHLQSNGLGAGGLKALAALDLPRLELLDLRHNALKSSGAKALAAAKLVSKLTRLELQRDDVGAGGVKALAQSTVLPSPLRTLWKGLHATQPSAAEDE